MEMRYNELAWPVSEVQFQFSVPLITQFHTNERSAYERHYIALGSINRPSALERLSIKVIRVSAEVLVKYPYRIYTVQDHIYFI